jgi:hypothetical protein
LDISGCSRLTTFGDISTNNVIEINLSNTPFEEYDISSMCPLGTKTPILLKSLYKYGF